MSEYWVSKKKYFCKYCDIYIADDAPSRQQHENGLRHKGNKERFIREIYKAGEKAKKDKQDEEREMRAVEQAALAAYAKDVGLAAAAAAHPLPSSLKAPPKQTKSGDIWANYSTAASLGIVDVEAERLAAETAVRQKEGRVGEWSTVTVIPSLPSGPTSSAQTPPSAVTKRTREPSPEDEDDTRRFKVRQRAAVGLNDDIYDPGEIRVKRRETDTSTEVVKTEAPTPQGSLLPQWQPTQWRRAGPMEESSSSTRDETTGGPANPTEEVPQTKSEQHIKSEPPDDATSVPVQTPDQPLPVSEGNDVNVKSEPPAEEKPSIVDQPTPSSGSLFKKRKVKSSTASGRRPA
ncbi:hypothetical protein FRB99_008898 [Tulasnella sp. 403]|nr:hypothetical protein FRB99_008898 [Tulasnella sp. 403]